MVVDVGVAAVVVDVDEPGTLELVVALSLLCAAATPAGIASAITENRSIRCFVNDPS